MLTSELLVTRTRGDDITPVFIPPDADHLELARDIIAIFSDHTGKKLGDLNDILEEMEDQGFDYRLVRGLVSLLERRCDLQVESVIDPETARRAVFAESARVYPVISAQARSAVIHAVAGTLSISDDQLEQAMYADLEGQLVLNSFRPPSPGALVYYYNLSLAQTLLFKAVQLKFRASTGHQEVLRQVKRLGLMYDAAYENSRLEIIIDGPTSAMKLTERYGTAFARLLPPIIRSPGWAMEASIVRKDYEGNPHVYRFSLSSHKHGQLFGSPPGEEVTFDSTVEEAFYKSMAGTGTGWSISREPEPLIAGKYLFIPDFLLEKDGIKVYVEIAGFWTPEYLKRKASKLKDIKDKNLIVLADAKLSCEAFREVPGVIFFEKKVPVKPVLDRLRALEQTNARAGAEKINQESLRLEGPVLKISGIANGAGVSIDAMRLYLEGHKPAGYTNAGDELISNSLIGELQAELPGSIPYADAVAIIRRKGITAADTVIKLLGYTVRWSGLDPDSAVIYRAK